MRWADFEKEETVYQGVWQKMKSEYTGKMRKFLDTSYLVIVYDSRQIAFGLDAFSIAKESPGFLVNNKESHAYLKLIGTYKQVEKDVVTIQRNRILGKIRQFNIENLSVVSYYVEVRFPTVNMEHIQSLKQSRYCDQKLTSMSRASIRVVLKKG